MDYMKILNILAQFEYHIHLENVSTTFGLLFSRRHLEENGTLIAVLCDGSIDKIISE